MKKFTLIISLCTLLASCRVAPAEKNFQHILDSKDIKEIERFLTSCHPDDPRRNVLKPKLIALKNAEWTKGGKNARPMEARPVISEIHGSLLRRNSNPSEAEEFRQLLASSSKEHKNKTVQLLNAMFNEDLSNKEAIILFKNNSDCNLVVRLQGKGFYNMAVPAKSENFIVIQKGNYTITSNVCDILYSSRKEIGKSIFLTIGDPVYAEK